MSVLFREDGAAGDIAWQDTVSGRRGDASFAAAEDSILQYRLRAPDGRHYYATSGQTIEISYLVTVEN